MDVLTECIGAFGKWQFWMSFAIFMSKFSVAQHMLSIVMIGPEMKFNCSDANYTACDTDCPSHDFDYSVFAETINTKWDLVCKRAWLRDLAQSITMAGVLCGNLVWGYISDRYGRLCPLVVEVLLQGVTGIVVAFVPWFWLFNVMRFLAAFATGGSMITGFVLLMEIIGVRHRTVVGILYQIPFYLGHLLLPLFGFLCREWKCVQLLISAPSLLLVIYYWVLPESPRWLALQGDYEKAANVLKKAAKFNKMPTEGIDAKVRNLVTVSAGAKPKKGNAIDLVRTPIIRKYTICIVYNWIVCATCYFGVAQYTGKLSGNVFLNVTISALTQVPSCLFACWSTKALGRKLTLILADAFGAVGMLAMIAVPDNLYWINYINITIAMAGFSLGFPTVYIYSGELFPTNVRNVGCGICSMCGRMGAIIAPYIGALSKYQWWLPPAIFGIIPFIGVFLCFFLPETLDCKLPDTVEEVEAAELEKKKNRKNNTGPSTSH